MADGFYLAVCKELKIFGFSYATNAKDSHEKWVNGDGIVLIVPRNLKSRFTANAILKDAGSAVKF